MRLTSGGVTQPMEGYPDTVTVRRTFRVAALDGRPITVSHSPNITPLFEGPQPVLEGWEFTIPAAGCHARFDTVRTFTEWEAVLF